jgi:hypothetical protein
VRHSRVVTSISMVTVYGGLQRGLEGWMFGQEEMVGDVRWHRGGVGYQNCLQCQVNISANPLSFIMVLRMNMEGIVFWQRS